MDPKLIILNQNDLDLMEFSSTGTVKFELLFIWGCELHCSKDILIQMHGDEDFMTHSFL